MGQTPKKGGLKPRKGIEIKVPRRSRVEISILRTSQRGPFRPKKGPKRGPFRVLRDEKSPRLAGHRVFLTAAISSADVVLFFLNSSADVPNGKEDVAGKHDKLLCFPGERLWGCGLFAKRNEKKLLF